MTIKNSLLIILLLAAPTVKGQEFRYKAVIGEVPRDGFYRIEAGTDIRARAATDLRDLRIRSSQGKVFPYLVMHPDAALPTDSFHTLPVISRSVDSVQNTIVIVENTTGQGVERLSVASGNTTVSRRCHISGSNDLQSWFSISEDLPYPAGASSTSDFYQVDLRFPLIRYRYLKVLITKGRGEAVDIKRVGTVRTGSERADGLVSNPQASFIRRDSSNGKSYIFVRQTAAYPVDVIKIGVGGIPVFRRSAEILGPVDSVSGRSLLSSFVLSSDIAVKEGADLLISVPMTGAFKVTTFCVVIDNGDNLPLEIKTVATFSKPLSLFTWLSAGTTYELWFGNDTLRTPNYDLEFFRNRVKGDEPILSYGEITGAAEPKISTAMKQKTKNPWVLWSVILASLGLLSAFTWKLTREMSRRK
ncbi:MAG: DUF3999 family protein [Sphingobacteriales bacterium]|nr:MAG: DUF3999 family protein [Sphingobacteriales bacterium]